MVVVAAVFRFETAASRDLPPAAMAQRGAGDTCSRTLAAAEVRPEDEDDLLARWELWKTEHPRRNYIQVGPLASPCESSAGSPGAAAPGAPALASTRYSEVVRVLFAQRMRQSAGVRRVAGEPSLFQYADSASGESYQHTTSIQRMAALANSHPLVATMRLSCLRHVLDEDAVVDHEGRAKTTADDSPPRRQSPYDLSLSLARSGRVFKVGLSTRRKHPTLFFLWWKAQGPGWKDSEINRARATFFDLAELDGDHILTAAHDVDEAEEADDSSDESDSSNPAADAESSGDDEGREDDDEESPGAASGALRGLVKQRRLVGLCSLERSRVVQRATEYRRRAFFNDDVVCPRGRPPTRWLVSDRTLHKRRTRTSKLVHILERDSCPVPLESEFRTGIVHLNDNPDQQEKLFSVVRAFATHKMHYLGLLRTLLSGLSFRDKKFFCQAFPVLRAASSSGSRNRVEYAAPAHPVWAVLQETYGVTNVPCFVQHLFSKHNGEARLIGETSWTRLEGDVRDPQFWSYQFATTEATRRFLASTDPERRLTWDDVHCILDQDDGRTLLIKRVRAASGAPASCQFFKKSGRVVTLPEMTYLGVLHKCTCFDIYKLYMDLPVFCHRRDPPGTHRAKKRRRTS